MAEIVTDSSATVPPLTENNHTDRSNPQTSLTPPRSSQGCGDDPILSPTETETETSIPSKKRKKDDDKGNVKSLTSTVWNHFGRKNIDGVWKAIRNYCSKKLSGELKNGTTHLRNHYNVCIQRTTTDIRQTMLNKKASLDGKVSLEKHMFDQKEARKELASMIVLHEYPLSIVDHFGFRRFTSTLQPLFKPVSRNTIKKSIFEIYDLEKDKSLRLLEANKSRIAITTDMWTSSNQKKGFMVVTAHYIDESWLLQNRILRFVYIPHPHTADDLSSELIDTLVEWNINRKLSSITVDNCATNDLMIKIIEDKFSEEDLLLKGRLLHMRCAAHILNLIVRDGMDVIGNAIDKIRDSVSYWRATPKRCETFEKMARNLKVETSKKLILDCKTRWNSTFMMLEVALCYKEVFPSMKLKDKKDTCLPSESDWKLAQDICAKLKTFYEVSTLFSGTSYPTANEYFAKVCHIKIDLTKWMYDKNETISTMANTMFEKFNQYWMDVNGPMAVAAVLDPRYKLTLVRFYFDLIYGPLGTKEVDNAIKYIEDFCQELFEDYVERKNFRKGGESPKVPKTSTSNIHDPLSQYDAYVEKSVSTKPEVSELKKYLNEPVKPRTPDFDVLAWWKVNARDFPILALIAKDILAVPVSTVASESAFSTSGRFVSPQRSRLHPKTLEALMCAQDWLWAKIKGSSTVGHDYEEMEEEEEEDVVDLT